MSKATPAARKVASKVADKLENLVRQVWQEEAHLTAAGGSGTDPEAAKLAEVLGRICVDRLHPSIEALRKAAEPTKRSEEVSADEIAPVPMDLAEC